MRGHHRWRPGQPHERGPDRFRDPLVEFVRNDTADVVSLEDLRVLPHVGLASRSLSVAPSAQRIAPRPGPRCMDTEPTGLPPPPAVAGTTGGQPRLLPGGAGVRAPPHAAR